jgi:hypothetical protein
MYSHEEVKHLIFEIHFFYMNLQDRHQPYGKNCLSKIKYPFSAKFIFPQTLFPDPSQSGSVADVTSDWTA